MSNINYQSAFITNTHLFIDKIYFYNTPLVRSIRVLTTYLLFIISVQNSNRLFSATEAVYIIVNEFLEMSLFEPIPKIKQDQTGTHGSFEQIP